MKSSQIYTINISRNGRDRTTSGTLQELTDYFGYTLEVGNSYNKSVNRNPKNINSVDNFKQGAAIIALRYQD
mgnify:FL=1